MTRELFSDEVEEERGSEVEVTPLSTPLPGTKRTNPFKVSIVARSHHYDVITRTSGQCRGSFETCLLYKSFFCTNVFFCTNSC